MKLKNIEKALELIAENLSAPDGILDRFEKRLDEAQASIESKGEVLSKLAEGKELKQMAVNRVFAGVDRRVDKLVRSLGGKAPKA